jgi:pimeloyl-ACP methyl ester carboxylesterase
MTKTGVPAPAVVSVAGGREVGVYEYGDPAGRPVLALHGVPASGAGFAWTDEPARERGLRVLAPDRPGIGRSTPVDGADIAGYPALVAALADAMDIPRFGVLGYSGGGPYAVALAAGLPERVQAVAVCAGMGQIGEWATIDDFEKTDRQFLAMSTKRPALARLVLGTVSRLARLSPGSAYKSMAKQLAPGDQPVLDTLGPPAEAMAMFTEAFTSGARGVVDDYRAINGPWGVDLAAITAPVRIYQGDADTMVPLRHAEELAKRLPAADLVRWPGAGHLGTIAHIDEILDWLAGELAEK